MARSARRRIGTPRYRRILWPTDFSALAEAALPHALALAQGGRAELIVLHVLSPLTGGIYAAPDASGALWGRLAQESRRVALAELQRRTEQVGARNSRLRIRSLLVQGSPVAEIVRTAKRLRCDLIVLATHGRTGLRHMMMGSVAENVVRGASCPVLSVRPRADLR